MTSLAVLKSQCEKLGITIVEMEHGKRHVHVRLRASDGRETGWLASRASGSQDPRGVKNNFARLRRWAADLPPTQHAVSGSCFRC